MNFQRYRRCLMMATDGMIPRRILRQWRRNWHAFRRIAMMESLPPIDPRDYLGRLVA